MDYNSGNNRASNFKSSPITPELYDTQSYYQLIVSITKCENISPGIFINVRERFHSKHDRLQLWMKLSVCVEARPQNFFFFFCKNTFLIKMRQYLNKMRKFLKVIESNYSLSRQLTDSMAKTFPVEAGQLTQSLYFR